MEDNPLDLEFHEEEDSVFSVVKRRIMFVVLIGLCVAMAAPSFASCESALGGRTEGLAGRYQVGEETVQYSHQDFNKARLRLWAANRIMGRQGADDDDQSVWHFLLLDSAAKAAGIHMPREEVGRRLLEGGPVFREFVATDGQIDGAKYAAYVESATGGQVSPETATQALTEMLRGNEYLMLHGAVAMTTTERDAFEAWRKDNPKLSVTYAALPFATFEAEVAATKPTDDELRLIQQDPKLREQFRIPSRRKVESAFLRIRDLSAEDVERMRAIALEEGLLDPEEPEYDLDVKAFEIYHRDRSRVFTKEGWLQLRDADVAPWLTGAASNDGSEDGGGDDEDGSTEDVAYPDSDEQRFEDFWRPWARREWLARAVVERLAEVARRDGRSFAEVAQEAPFAALDVQVVENEELLAADEFAESYPEGLARESEFANLLRGELTGPADGATFLPKVRPGAIGTTNVMTRLADRGSMVLRLSAWQPPRDMEPAEIRERDDLLAAWRQWKVEDMVSKRLKSLVEEVEGGADLTAAAEAAGLSVRRLERFHRTERRLTPPSADPGEELSPELAALAERIRHRNRVVERYGELRNLDVGALLLPPRIDPVAEAGLLIRLDAKDAPSPREMGERELQGQLQTQRLEQRMELFQMVDFDSLAERFQLEIFEEEAPATDDSETPTE